jgi:membrane protease YdiL (CAAX protease family)
MPRIKTQPRPDWRAVLTFYLLACAFQWPFFWWRDVNTASWNASRIPTELRDLTWGPAVAAFLVLYLFPHARTGRISFFGTSRARSLCFFLIPILFSWIGVAIQTGRISYKLIYYLLVGGVSIFGEEMGWRGFLQGALRPLGRVRGYLLLAFMWEAWHFTSHTRGTLHQVIERLAIYVPLVIVITFILGFLTERTGSLLLATTFHEWMDILADPAGSGGLFWCGLACIPVWIWLVWTWPKRKPAVAEDPNTSETAAARAQ